SVFIFPDSLHSPHLLSFPTRRSSDLLSDVLTHSGTRSVKGTRSHFRQGLVVVQVALTFVLLTGSGLLIRSLLRVQSVEKGFEPQDRKSTRLNSSHVSISYAVFCLKKK